MHARRAGLIKLIGFSRVRDRDPAVVEDLLEWCPRCMFSESQARLLLEMVVYEDEVALLECSQVAVIISL